VLATLKSDYVDLPETALKEILTGAFNSESAETVSDASALIHHLGEHRFDTFGELLAINAESAAARLSRADEADRFGIALSPVWLETRAVPPSRASASARRLRSTHPILVAGIRLSRCYRQTYSTANARLTRWNLLPRFSMSHCALVPTKYMSNSTWQRAAPPGARP
jgi:hypothetical protein